jgi:hypothetical protein
MSGILAWIPFLQPMTALGNGWWLLMVPLVFGVAVVHRAVQDASMEGYWGRVLHLTVKANAILGLIALAFFLFVYLVIPLLRAD